MQKARSQRARRSEDHEPPPTACRHVVSGSLSLPAQGCFSPVPHGTRPLSVTQESLALEGGPPSFTPGFSCRALLRNSTTTASGFALPGSHRLWRPVPGDFTLASHDRVCGSYNPEPTRSLGLGSYPFRSPLLRASRLISLPPGTEMFQFPGFASACDSDDRTRARPGCPIRPSRDHCVCATPPSLSQLTTAFIASVCPGIPHMPSFA